MWYIILAIALVLAALMLLRFRIRLLLSQGHALLFIGLGHSGREFDFLSGEGSVRLLGLKVRILPTEKKPKADRKPKPDRRPKEKKSPRYRSPVDILKVLPATSRALGNYLLALAKSLILEEATGEIRAGFDRPDLTGRTYGFYQAVQAATPALVGRFRFVPDWDGPSLSGSARLSVAIPLYRVFLKTISLLFKLPLRDLIKLAIGKKKGDRNVQ
jgi:hypothetical protein